MSWKTSGNPPGSPSVSGRTASLVVFAFGVATLAGDCDRDIAQDPTFRDWCGDVLCAWHRDEGTVEPVPTWNEHDLGVSFVDTPTQISQVTTESSASCLLFTSVADIDPAAQMSIAVDFNSDGSFESTSIIGSTQWQRVQTAITAPAAYQGITFVIRKTGTGTAILAEMRIQSSSQCTPPPAPIDAGEGPGE